MLKTLRDEFGAKITLPEAKDLPKATQGVFPWMWFFVKPYRHVIFFSMILRIIRYTIYGLTYYFFGLLIDALQSGWALQHMHQFIMNLGSIALLCLFVMVSFQLLFYESTATDKMQRGLTLFSISHLLQLSLDWHEQQGSGGKLQRVMQARENLRQIYFTFTRRGLFFVGEVIAVAIAIIAMKMPIFMLYLFAGYIGSYIFIFWLLNRSIYALTYQQNILKEKLVSKIYDFVSLIRVAKAFSLDDYVIDRSMYTENEAHLIQRKIKFRQHFRWSMININVWFWILLIVGLGLQHVWKHDLSIGAFSSLIFMSYRLWNTLEEIVIAQIDYVEYKAGFLRIRETLSVPVQNFDVAPVVDVPQHWDKIECRDMVFSYHVEQPVLQHINMSILRGQHIAMVGHSGAGKSTMVKLLMKQIVPTGGELLVGEVPMQHIDSKNWLSHLALVPQDVELMNATLRENILLDQTEIDEEFYRDCLRKAYLEEFVATLPNGDLTEIGERGVKLSGGQRQRLGIARALARNADIIILDEATSSLDSESEQYIQQAMLNAFKGKTVIVIAHRLSTIRHADVIHVFDQGRISESGNFVALEKNNGIFARLWAMQSNGFIAD
jgi:ATP-binding cassette subfamily B protein